jgi:hypothetical protein
VPTGSVMPADALPRDTVLPLTCTVAALLVLVGVTVIAVTVLARATL